MLGAGIAYNIVPTKREEPSFDPTAVAADTLSTTAVDNAVSQQEAERVIAVFERNIQNADPTEQDFETLKTIIAEYPDLKSRIYDMYYNEGNRRSSIDANAGANHLAMAQRIKNL